MIAISTFGVIFAWLMVFVTHLAFRRRHHAAPGDFRMVGAPWTTLLGATLLLAVLVTTIFTSGFRSTLLYGIPFLALLTLLYWLRAPKTRPDADLSEKMTA
jgi:L-asparagine transporter-like permease